jgi:hypothetical protein
VRGQGLSALSPRRTSGRIDAAHSEGLISSKERSELESELIAPVEAGGKEAMLDYVVGRAALEDPHGSGCFQSMSAWGSEGAWSRVSPVREALGEPTIVLAAVDLLGSDHVRPFAPEPAMCRVFAGTLLESPHRYATVQVRLGVPAGQALDEWQPGHPSGPDADVVLCIWQPGDPEYERYRELPR